MRGIERFRAYFEGFEDRYVLIGGAACELVLDEANLPFRGTKDLDIVLCVEVIDAEFARQFWAFIEEGGYEARQHSSGEKEYYRFVRPRSDDFPFMLELFARKPDVIDLKAGGTLTPLPMDDDVASLSAILLDDIYYQVLMENRRMVEGLTVLDERLLIPFKAKAFLDLSDRKARGDKVDEKNIRKHRNDVFRLLQLLREGEVITLPPVIAGHLSAFCDVVSEDAGFVPKEQGLGGEERAVLVARLSAAFGLRSE